MASAPSRGHCIRSGLISPQEYARLARLQSSYDYQLWRTRYRAGNLRASLTPNDLDVSALQELLKHYNWVGFYMLDDGDAGTEPMLVLGPYVGRRNAAQTHPVEPGNLWRCRFFSANCRRRRRE